MNRKRISYIDMAKGIGIILVVLGHSTFPTNEMNQWIASFHMPLFFILSGMLLNHTGAHEKPFSILLQKKARTILIPYLSFSALSILFSLILNTSSPTAYLLDALLQTILFYGISVLWFLPTLFLSELVFLFIRKKTSLPMTAFLSLAVCLISVLVVNTYHYHYLIDFDNYRTILGSYIISVFVRSGIGVIFLAFGYFSHLLFFQTEHSKTTYLLLACIFFLLNYYFAFKNGGVDLRTMVFHDYRLYFPAAFCGSMFIICLCAALPAWKPLIAAGQHSLIIMATHINCRFLGICYAFGNLTLKVLPFIGQTGYMITCAIAMILLEAMAIYIINHFLPFIIGQTRCRKKVL